MQLHIHIILVDSKNKSKWETPAHHENSKKDDFHRIVKPRILKDISRKLKDKLGNNCDIEINDGLIIVISQKISNDTGKKIKERAKTNLAADKYFNRISYNVITTSIEIIYFRNRSISKIDIRKPSKFLTKIYFYVNPVSTINFVS